MAGQVSRLGHACTGRHRGAHPCLAASLDSATTRTIRLLCLGVGGVILLYVLTQNIRFVGIGLIMAAAGYALEIVGVLRKRSAGNA